jgi:hypothetical protein
MKYRRCLSPSLLSRAASCSLLAFVFILSRVLPPCCQREWRARREEALAAEVFRWARAVEARRGQRRERQVSPFAPSQRKMNNTHRPPRRLKNQED